MAFCFLISCWYILLALASADWASANLLAGIFSSSFCFFSSSLRWSSSCCFWSSLSWFLFSDSIFHLANFCYSWYRWICHKIDRKSNTNINKFAIKVNFTNKVLKIRITHKNPAFSSLSVVSIESCSLVYLEFRLS